MRNPDILVEVPENRVYLARLRFQMGNNERIMPVSAMILPDVGLEGPTMGLYIMTQIVDISLDDEEAIASYGPKVIFFKKGGGEEILAIHGGESDHNGDFLATEGGLRLSNEDLLILCDHFKKSPALLKIEEYKMGIVEKITGKKVSKFYPEPMRRGKRTQYREEQLVSDRRTNDYSGNDSDFLFWYWLLCNHNVTTSSAETVPGFTPGGGEFGGAGSSGDYSQQDSSVVASNNEQTGTLPLIVDPFPVEQSPVVTTEKVAQEPSQEEQVPHATDAQSDSVSQTESTSSGTSY